MSVERNLYEMERVREANWLRNPRLASLRLRRRALTLRHCLHILPGEKILELGAGSGLWTEQFSTVLRGENPITAAVFDKDLSRSLSSKNLPNTEIVHLTDLESELPLESFDYVIGTEILCQNLYPQTLTALHRLLKPGGQMLFFDKNLWNPRIFCKTILQSIERFWGIANCQVGLSKYQLMKIASHQGFVNIDIIPFNTIYTRLPQLFLPLVKTISFLQEHTPVLSTICDSLYIWLKKPAEGGVERNYVDLATHPQLFDSVSVVVPCHNEQMNVPKLVEALVQTYDNYLHEIIIVNDNSTDQTADVTWDLAQRDPRIKLINRSRPNGVGLALRDGYAAATGRYILTMDCDFAHIVPEFRDLFDVVASGRDGAIGSRFSQESVLINYPFFKVLCNRSCHVLIRLLLPIRVRDISNNLKLYRAEILKGLEIEEDGFAANMETGLKPILSGYDIREVPISWINRTTNMGTSSFRLLQVAPGYLMSLLRTIFAFYRGKRTFIQKTEKDIHYSAAEHSETAQ